MAFPGYRRQEVSELEPGDGLFLYTTRGCFHNPGRHRSRVIGLAEALDKPTELPEPVEVAGRSFTLGCSIQLKLLAPFGAGVDFAALVPQLESFPNKHGWATRLRRPLVGLTRADGALLARRLRPLGGPPAAAVDTYARPAARAS